MLTLARVVFFAFAALLILGGIAGFVEKRSVMSLLSGLLCGGLGLYAGIVLPTHSTRALVLGLIGAVLAGGGMAPRLKDKETGQIKMWPAGAVVAASALTAIVAAAALATGANKTPSATAGAATGSTSSSESPGSANR